MAEPMSGSTSLIDGRFQLGERLHGAEGLGVWEGTEPGEGDRPVLVSLGPHAGDVFDELLLDVPGVPTLLAVGDAPDGRTAVVEEHPPGAIAAPAPEEAAALGAEVAEIAAFVHHMGLALGGIRPESVWRGDEVSISPRLTRLWELSRQSLDAPGGPSVYISLGRLRGTGPTPPDDVFALGATIAWWATGATPSRARRAESRSGRSTIAAGARGPATRRWSRSSLRRCGRGRTGRAWSSSRPCSTRSAGAPEAARRIADRTSAWPSRPEEGGATTERRREVDRGRRGWGEEQSWGRSLSGDRGREVIAICDEDLP